MSGTTSKTNTPAAAPAKNAVVPKGLSSTKRKKKLTIQEVCGTLHKNSELMAEVKAAGPDGVIWLADFYCMVTKRDEQVGNYGPYYRWLGEFRSVNTVTGELLKSSNAILPEIYSDLINGKWEGADKGDNIVVGFRVGISHDPNNDRVGYKYECQDISPTDASSPLDLLYDQAMPKRAA